MYGAAAQRSTALMQRRLTTGTVLFNQGPESACTHNYPEGDRSNTSSTLCASCADSLGYTSAPPDST
jgi:hypothetical protein